MPRPDSRVLRLICSLYLGLMGIAYGDGESEPCQSQWPEPPALKVVTTPFPPYVVPEGDSASGPATEVVRQTCQRAGVRCEFHVLPWARSYHLAQTEPGTLIYSMSRNEERDPLFTWLGRVSPYSVKLFALRDSSVPEVSDWRELSEYSVAGQLKDVKALYLDDAGFDVDYTGTAENTIKMLYHNRVHLVAGDARSLPYRVRTMGLPLEQLRVVAEIEPLSSELYLAAHLDTPAAVTHRLSSCLASIHSDGTYDRIWNGSEPSE